MGLGFWLVNSFICMSIGVHEWIIVKTLTQLEPENKTTGQNVGFDTKMGIYHLNSVGYKETFTQTLKRNISRKQY